MISSFSAIAARLPRWRGFNLVEKCRLEGQKPFAEWDFDFVAEFGFDFIRLPLDYRIWTAPSTRRVWFSPMA